MDERKAHDSGKGGELTVLSREDTTRTNAAPTTRTTSWSSSTPEPQGSQWGAGFPACQFSSAHPVPVPRLVAGAWPCVRRSLCEAP